MSTSEVLARARRLHALGLSVIALQPRAKEPETGWKRYQAERPTEAELAAWFGNGVRRNIGIVLGEVSGDVVAVDTDNPKAEAWAEAHLPPTPMMTRTPRGWHRYYRRPPVDNLPQYIYTSDGQEIELRRDGNYVVAPGSVHPSGVVYSEVAPWPDSLDALPFFPASLLGDRTRERESAPPLPSVVGEGGRNNVLFREAARLRSAGWEHPEILNALVTLNQTRCRPPLPTRELETIAQSACRYTPRADTFPLTEAGDAEFFAALFGEQVRYDHRRGRWLLFREHRWAPQTDGEVHRLALDAVRARQVAATKITDSEKRKAHLKFARDGEQLRRQRALLALAQNLKPVADAGDNWDANPWLLGVDNGVVDLRTGTLRDGRPEDRITMQVRAAYDPEAACPLWDKTVSEIFGHDRELVAYFDRYVGYSLTGDCREESLAFCWGEGANGKGTLMNTIGWLLGDYADDLPFSALEMHERSSIPNDIAKLVGKRFVTSSETGETRRLNEARIKALTGRDPITARFLHREFFTFQPFAKFWLATNQKPEVRDTSTGFWRRLHLIPFTQTFADKPDLELKDKLRQEAAGILARAVRGCLAWQAEGLSPPEAVRQATQAYRNDSTPLAQFLAECCVLGDDARATAGDLFAAYQNWSGRSGPRMTRREFMDELPKRFQKDEGATSRTQRVTYRGVGLVSMFREDL